MADPQLLVREGELFEQLLHGGGVDLVGGVVGAEGLVGEGDAVVRNEGLLLVYVR